MLKVPGLYLFFLFSLLRCPSLLFSQPVIADHTCTNIYDIPIAAIETAKEKLHIAYGHTSHGSQITSGMSGLVDFMNSKGYPLDLFKWNHSGENGTLHLYEGDGYGDGDLDHDAGYYPKWVNETRAYLGTPDSRGRGSRHPEMNVIMWSWCGQLSWYDSTNVFDNYINEMVQFEQEYPGISFVYMTGHSDGSGLEGTLHKNNQLIRKYCIENNKVLFDFYDIECYDPDGNYFGDRYVSDNCNYDGGNWALEWQNSHEKGVDWFECDAAHSKPLNGNLKAYAIWWLWARIAGWDGQPEQAAIPEKPGSPVKETIRLEQNFPNPFNSSTTIRFSLTKKATVHLKLYNLQGQTILDLVKPDRSPGTCAIQVSSDKMSSGIYYYQLIAGDVIKTKKLTVLR